MDNVDVADNALSIVGKVALGAGEAALFTAYPFLGIWPIRIFIMILLSIFETAVIKELQKTTNAVLIFQDEEAKAQKANNASDQLKAAQDDPKTTPKEKQKALQDFKDAYADLIRFRISSDSLG